MTKPFFQPFQPFQATEDLICHMDKGTFSLPVQGESLIVQDESLSKFLALDYRISNPRLLSGDIQNKITGDSFSQSKISNYVVGVAGIEVDLAKVPYADYAVLRNSLGIFRSKLCGVLASCDVTGVRGSVAAFVSDTDLNDSLDVSVSAHHYYVPFLISTSVFYNNYRATIGFGNQEADLVKIKESIVKRLGNFKLCLLSPEFSMAQDDWEEIFTKVVNSLEESDQACAKIITSDSDFDKNVFASSNSGSFATWS